MDLFRARQWAGDCPRVFRKDIHPFPTVAWAKGVRGHRHRTGCLQEDSGTPGRPDLGRVATRQRVYLLLHPACSRGEMMELIGPGGEPIEVLLVEDSPGDVRLTREALKDAKVQINLHIAQDGTEAMAFLRNEGAYTDVPRPDLILLDLNLPKKDGREVLEEIKKSPTLKSIPVVILTTSASEADILKSYRLHANCYITKPVGLSGFLEVIKSIDNFWLSVVKLPREEV